MCRARQVVACVLCRVPAFCDVRDSLDNLCGQITGDATLYSMFRSDAGPTECPFRGGPPFTFTYNRGYGECINPVSRVDSCTDESRLLLRYQACPDVPGTESTGELKSESHKPIYSVCSVENPTSECSVTCSQSVDTLCLTVRSIETPPARV